MSKLKEENYWIILIGEEEEKKKRKTPKFRIGLPAWQHEIFCRHVPGGTVEKYFRNQPLRICISGSKIIRQMKRHLFKKIS